MKVCLEALDGKRYEMTLGAQRSGSRFVLMDKDDVVVKTAGAYDRYYSRTGCTFAGLRVYRYEP